MKRKGHKIYIPKISEEFVSTRRPTQKYANYVLFLAEFMKLWQEDIKSKNPVKRYTAFQDVELCKQYPNDNYLLIAFELITKVDAETILQEIKPLEGVTESQITEEYFDRMKKLAQRNTACKHQRKQIEQIRLTA